MPQTILLIEDDVAIADTLIYAMQREGWQAILDNFKNYVEAN